MENEIKKVKFTQEEKFIPLKSLLLQDNEEVKKIKSLYKKEDKYVMFLAPIELFIAYFYINQPKIKDADVISTINNIRANYDKDLSFFKIDFEREFIEVISFILQDAKKKITRHELFLVLGYILWSIDNRRWLGDPRAYLNWVANFFDLLNKNERKRFNESYDELGRNLGIDEDRIKVMKNEKHDVNFTKEDEKLSELESQKFTDPDLWEDGSFAETMSHEEMEEKMKTFHKKHDEDMNYDCKKCNKKISAHNKDWHDGMCDDCFNKTYYKE